MSDAIRAGSRVRLRYTLSFPDGTFIEGTGAGAPVTVTVGSGELAPFLETYLLGLWAGEKRRIEMTADETRSATDREAVQKFARSDFPARMSIVSGSLIEFQSTNGEMVPGVVVEIDAASVTVDFSHPLSGRDIVFEVEVLDVENVPLK